jgi:hypothetical protein
MFYLDLFLGGWNCATVNIYMTTQQCRADFIEMIFNFVLLKTSCSKTITLYLLTLLVINKSTLTVNHLLLRMRYNYCVGPAIFTLAIRHPFV